MKYSEIPEDINWEEGYGLTPLMVDLGTATIKGYKYVWKSERFSYEQGYLPVPSHFFPKLPSSNGFIKWKDAHLCFTIDIDAAFSDSFIQIDILNKLQPFVKREVSLQISEYLKCQSLLQRIKIKLMIWLHFIRRRSSNKTEKECDEDEPS